MRAYRVLKSIYHAVLPPRVRTFLWQNPVTRGPREWMLRRAERLATHDEMYDQTYYERAVDPLAASSAPVIARSLIDATRPRTLVDVGCGTGAILAEFGRQGVSGRGLEYSEAAIKICRGRGLDVIKYDIEHDAPVDWKADLVVSTEVAEHLPASCADKYVDLLCGIAGSVFVTASPPGQTGTDHVNEQPNEYWVEKFARRGMRYDEGTSLNWRRAWRDAGVAECYCESAMLFRRDGGAGARPA